jgi:hypothetical protein
MEWFWLILLSAIVYSLYAADVQSCDGSDDPVGQVCLRFWRYVRVFR